MSTPSWLLPRRSFLKSASACIALPLLDAMVPPAPLGNPAKGAVGGVGKPPVRLAWLYVPNGVWMPKWRPAQPGLLTELPELLAPLAPHKDRIVVLSDLEAKHCGAHEETGGGFLTGLDPKHSQVAEVGGPSIDQVAAKMIGDKTQIDSMTMGTDPGHEGDHGWSGTYMGHISWINKTTPSALEVYPKALFDRLFGGRQLKAPNWQKPKTTTQSSKDAKLDREQQLGTSILDLLRHDARKLIGNLGSNDRVKMEGYLDGIRGIERRLDLADKDSAEAQADQPAMKKANRGAWVPPELMVPQKDGKPALHADLVNLFLDMLVMAFWTDTTRIGTFMFSFEKSWGTYPEIGAPNSHHNYSHHGNNPENISALTKINTHHVSLFSRFLTNLSRMKELDGSLLDNVAIMYGSGISDGNQHNNDNLPILLAGGGGGAIKGGRHIAFGKPTPICNLYLDMMDMAGLKLDNFGNSTGRLALK